MARHARNISEPEHAWFTQSELGLESETCLPIRTEERQFNGHAAHRPRFSDWVTELLARQLQRNRPLTN